MTDIVSPLGYQLDDGHWTIDPSWQGIVLSVPVLVNSIDAYKGTPVNVETPHFFPKKDMMLP